MTTEIFWQIFVTGVGFIATIVTVKVDLGWIKQTLRDHIREDNDRWNSIIQKGLK